MGAPSLESSLNIIMKGGVVLENAQITCNSSTMGSLWRPAAVSEELAHHDPPQDAKEDSREREEEEEEEEGGTLRLISCKKRAAMVRSSSRRRVLMTRRSSRANNDGEEGAGCIRRRRRTNGIERRVKTLKELVPPNRGEPSEEVGLDGLFRDTADYILSLQMKVRVMQVMVDLLSSSSPSG